MIVDPVRIIDLEGGGAGDAGDGNEVPPQLQQLANQHGGDGSAAAIAGQGQSPTNIDGSSSTTSFENAQTNAGGGTTGSSNITGGNIGGIEHSNATLAREYIWGPGGSFVGAAVGELLVQIDRDGRSSWVMQDAGGDVVALAVNTTGSGSAAVAATGMLASASGTGSGISFRVAAQQEYDAYGQVIWAEHLLNHAALHVGHKGLFVDRLDVGISELSGGMAATAKTFGEPPRIVPLAFNLAQNRNRVLHTGWGRYLQQDPNASGMAVISDTLMSGQRYMGMASPFYLDRLFGAGANLYQYVDSTPMTRDDPLGLFPGEYAINLGIGLAEMGSELIGIYSDNLSNDVDWATDWSQPDDAHSRLDNSWVSEVMNRNVNRMANDQLGLLGMFMPDGGGDDAGEGDETVMAGRYPGTSMAKRVLKIGRKAARTALHLHHSLPRYIAKAMGKNSKILIHVPDHLHYKYHSAVDNAIRAVGAPGKHKRTEALHRWINEYPDLAQARAASLVKSLRKATAQFSRDHKLSGLSEALEEAIGLMD